MEDGGMPNAGLHDQRFALEWVRDHIHMFGGDSRR
jgi:acetylcholinesterase